MTHDSNAYAALGSPWERPDPICGHETYSGDRVAVCVAEPGHEGDHEYERRDDR